MVNNLMDYYRNRNGLRTKSIRIYPKTFSGEPICMRVELYGCISGLWPTLLKEAQNIWKKCLIILLIYFLYYFQEFKLLNLLHQLNVSNVQNAWCNINYYGSEAVSNSVRYLPLLSFILIAEWSGKLPNIYSSVTSKSFSSVIGVVITTHTGNGSDVTN